MLPLKSHSMVRLSLTVLLACMAGWQLSPRAAESAVVIPPPAVDEPASQSPAETAVFAGGCFWGVQGVFQHVKGVPTRFPAIPAAPNPMRNTEYVGNDGHRPDWSCRIGKGDVYDPRRVTYGELLQVYFSVAHDPTQLNRQGPDSGTQYRSAIFPAAPMQQKIATTTSPSSPPRGIQCTHRDRGGTGQVVLPGRGLSSGLPGPDPN